MTCKDCLCYEVCKNRWAYEIDLLPFSGRSYMEGMEEKCEFFKPQSRFVKLPVELGQEVYTNTAMQGWYLRDKDKPFSAKVVFIGLNNSEDDGGGFFNVLYTKRDYMYQFKFSDIGKTVFLTKK